MLSTLIRLPSPQSTTDVSLGLERGLHACGTVADCFKEDLETIP